MSDFKLLKKLCFVHKKINILEEFKITNQKENLTIRTPLIEDLTLTKI